MNTQEVFLYERDRAILIMNSLLGTPDGFSNSMIDKLVDAIISAAVIKISMVLEEAGTIDRVVVK